MVHKRHYIKSFKEEGVRFSYERDNAKVLADELGISVARLYKWRAIDREKTLRNPALSHYHYQVLSRNKVNLSNFAKH